MAAGMPHPTLGHRTLVEAFYGGQAVREKGTLKSGCSLGRVLISHDRWHAPKTMPRYPGSGKPRPAKSWVASSSLARGTIKPHRPTIYVTVRSEVMIYVQGYNQSWGTC